MYIITFTHRIKHWNIIWMCWIFVLSLVSRYRCHCLPFFAPRVCRSFLAHQFFVENFCRNAAIFGVRRWSISHRCVSIFRWLKGNCISIQPQHRSVAQCDSLIFLLFLVCVHSFDRMETKDTNYVHINVVRNRSPPYVYYTEADLLFDCIRCMNVLVCMCVFVCVCVCMSVRGCTFAFYFIEILCA